MLTNGHWSSTTLGTLGDFRNGVNFDRSQEGAGLPILKVKDFGDLVFVPRTGLDELDTRRISVSENQMLKEGDTVIVRSNGNRHLVGRCLYFRHCDRDVTFSGFCIRFRPNPILVNPLFAAYFIRSPFCRERFAARGAGTGIQNLNQDVLAGLPVSLPPLSEQHQIVEVLTSLDEKIESNNRINDLLLRLAHTLFQHWFVDFAPFQKPGLEDSELGLIPKGWSVRPLYDSAKFINGDAFKEPDFSPRGVGLPVIKISELKNGITDTTRWCSKELEPRYRVRDGDILFSWSGSPETSIDIFLWGAGDGWLNQHTFRVAAHRPIERPFVFFLLKQMKPVFVRLASNKQTTGLGHVTAGDLKRLRVVLPPDSVLEQFNEQAGAWLDQMLANLKENELLTRTRDYLLPKLLSGEVSVENVEIVA